MVFVLYTHQPYTHARRAAGVPAARPGFSLSRCGHRPAAEIRDPHPEAPASFRLTVPIFRRMPRPADCNPAVISKRGRKRPVAHYHHPPPIVLSHSLTEPGRRTVCCTGRQDSALCSKNQPGIQRHAPSCTGEATAIFRTRGGQRTRLIWDQEPPGATPGCPTIFTPDSSDR